MTALEPLVFSQEDLDAWAVVSGANSPLHLDPAWAGPRFGGTIVPALLIVAAILQQVRRDVPHAEPLLLATRIRSAIHPGTVVLTDVERVAGGLAYACRREDGGTVVEGEIGFLDAPG